MLIQYNYHRQPLATYRIYRSNYGSSCSRAYFQNAKRRFPASDRSQRLACAYSFSPSATHNLLFTRAALPTSSVSLFRALFVVPIYCSARCSPFLLHPPCARLNLCRARRFIRAGDRSDDFFPMSIAVDAESKKEGEYYTERYMYV